MLTERLQSDLTTAMKARDTLVTSVLRMTIAAVKEAAVAGDSTPTGQTFLTAPLSTEVILSS